MQSRGFAATVGSGREERALARAEVRPRRAAAPQDSISDHDLQIVVVSPRSAVTFGLEALPVATLVALAPYELILREAPRADVYVVDARDDEQHDLVAQLAMGGSQPVVVIAPAAADAAVAYLDAGAADYVTEGTADDELAARLRAAARRGTRGRRDADVIRIGDLSVSIVRHEVYRREQLVALTPHEFMLLQTLLAARGEVVSHRKLMIGVWGVTNATNRHSLRVYVRQLRKKLEADPAAPAIIVSVRGLGYVIHR